MWSLKCRTQELQFDSKGETELELVIESHLGKVEGKVRNIYIHTEDEVK